MIAVAVMGDVQYSLQNKQHVVESFSDGLQLVRHLQKEE